MNNTKQEIPRAAGLLVIEVRNSNPNGDPDRESDPRTRAHDGKGVISDVSFKRKLRDLVWNGRDLPPWDLSTQQPAASFQEAYSAGLSPVWSELARGMGGLDPNEYQIYVCRGRTYQEPSNDAAYAEFKRRYWDCRLFGNTVIEKAEAEAGANEVGTSDVKKTKKAKKESGRYIRTGAVTFGIGISAAKVRIQRDTNTVKAAVQEGKDRGMAPLGFRVIEHGVYAMPFTVNPSAAKQSGCTRADLELMCRLIPYAYPHNASRIRPLVEVRHAWYFEHNSVLGSCSDFAIFDALTPKKAIPNEPSTSWDDYAYNGTEVLNKAKEDFKDRFSHFGDLCDPAFVNEVFPKT
jgi:CRISPR-associated protein Csd2